MLNRISVAHKMIGLVVGSVLLTAVTLGVITSQKATAALTVSEQEKLSGIVQSRKHALAEYLLSIEQDLQTTATNGFTLDALNAFKSGWNALEAETNPQRYLQSAYITNNPNPLGEKDALDAARDGSLYSEAHAAYHPWFRQFLKARGYYDIFLFDTDGSLVYSVFKELDYATNLRTGEYADTDLGNSFRAAADTLNSGEVAFFDFRPYAPSADAPASFMSTPITDASGRVAGVLVFQMPIDRLNAVLSSQAGLGETGETFVVGEDGLMRTDAPLAGDSTILKTKVPNEIFAPSTTTDAFAFRGEGYKGNEVLASSIALEFEGVKWYLIGQRDTSEALAAAYSTGQQVIWWSLGLIVVVGLISTFISNLLSRPLKVIAETTDTIAGGALQTEVPYREYGGEIGPLARSIDTFRQEMIRSEQLSNEQKERALADKAAAEQRAAEGQRLAQRAREFDEIVRRTLDEFSSASTNVNESAAAMSAISEETAAQTQGISAASQNASSNVQSVAAATEELSVSVNEIQSKVIHSQNATSNAVKQAQVMRERVAGLETAATAISDVVGLITSIAGQTNLLALNATIEAARAGEAGKGFAVVASEVKALATQTSKATEDIARQISAIQDTTSASVSGIHDILTAIADLESNSGEIASAINQQNAATLQISGSIQEAATNVQDVDATLDGVNVAAQEAGTTANRLREASDALTEHSKILRAEVEQFLNDVKAA